MPDAPYHRIIVVFAGVVAHPSLRHANEYFTTARCHEQAFLPVHHFRRLLAAAAARAVGNGEEKRFAAVAPDYKSR